MLDGYVHEYFFFGFAFYFRHNDIKKQEYFRFVYENMRLRVRGCRK